MRRRAIPCDMRALPLVLALAFLPKMNQPVAAQEAAGRPAYQSSRFDEDWSALRDPAKRTDPFDPIKFIPLTADGSWYMTLGGELREIDPKDEPRYSATYEIESPDVLTTPEWAEAVEQGRWPSEVRPYTRNRRHTLHRIMSIE